MRHIASKIPPIAQKAFCVSSLSKSKTDLSIMLTMPATTATEIHIKNKDIKKPRNENAFSGSLVTKYAPLTTESNFPAYKDGHAATNNKKGINKRFFSRTLAVHVGQ